MLALQIFSREQSDQGIPLRKTHIKGILSKYINFERLYKSSLIVGDSINSGNAPVYTLYVDITYKEII